MSVRGDPGARRMMKVTLASVSPAPGMAQPPAPRHGDPGMLRRARQEAGDEVIGQDERNSGSISPT